MKRRYKMNSKKSKKLFSKTASGSHIRNRLNPLRGGYRM